MNQKNMRTFQLSSRRYVFYFYLLLIFVCIFSNTYSQSNKYKIIEDKNDYFVTWLRNISTIDDLKGNVNFLKSVKDFLFGKNNIGLQKPVNLITIDTSLIIILDQGIQFPVEINTDKNSIEFNKERVSYPSLLGICKWKDNKILFTDSKQNRIYYFSPDDYTPILLNDKLTLNQPTGIGYSSKTNEIWVAETGNHKIYILDDKGNVKRTIGNRGSNKGQFNFPTHLWVDQNGIVYIVDAMNFRIQIYNSNGDFINMFGETGDSPGYFSSIKGIATDSFGHIYVVDALFNVIQVFDKDGIFLYTFGGQGKNDGEFYLPTGIFIDSYNKIYIADTYNSRIEIFQLNKGQK